MSFYVQHGYGKGQKIQHLDAAGTLSGVILSPSDEGPVQLRQTVEACQEMDLRVLLDPQTYIYSATPPGSPKRHLENGIGSAPIHWAQDIASVNGIISAIGALNSRLGIEDGLIAPTVVQPSFSDVWTPLALQFARSAASQWGESRTFATLALEEQALTSWPLIDQWLDIATTLEVRGFYIVVNRPSSTYPAPPWRAEAMANFLRLIYTLGQINGYEVIWGYSDIEGIIGLASGASGMGTGWNYGSRKFSLTKWQPTTGGRAPVPRFDVDALLTPLKAVGEVDVLFRSHFRDELFTPEEIQLFSSVRFEDWSRLAAQEHHLSFWADKASIISGLGNTTSRLDLVDAQLGAASEQFSRLRSAGLVLEPIYAARLQSFSKALTLFREAEAL